MSAGLNGVNVSISSGFPIGQLQKRDKKNTATVNSTNTERSVVVYNKQSIQWETNVSLTNNVWQIIIAYADHFSRLTFKQLGLGSRIFIQEIESKEQIASVKSCIVKAEYQKTLTWDPLEAKLTSLLSAQDYDAAEGLIKSIDNHALRAQATMYLAEYYLERATPQAPERSLALVDKEAAALMKGSSQAPIKVDKITILKIRQMVVEWHLFRDNTCAWEVLKPTSTPEVSEKEFDAANDVLKKAVALISADDFAGALKIAKEQIVVNPTAQFPDLCAHFVQSFMTQLNKHLDVPATTSAQAKKISERQIQKYFDECVKILCSIPDENHNKIQIVRHWKEHRQFQNAMFQQMHPQWCEEYDLLHERSRNLLKLAFVFINQGDFVSAFKVRENLLTTDFVFAFLYGLLAIKDWNPEMNREEVLDLVEMLPAPLLYLLYLEAKRKKLEPFQDLFGRAFKYKDLVAEANRNYCIVLSGHGHEQFAQKILQKPALSNDDYYDLFLLGRNVFFFYAIEHELERLKSDRNSSRRNEILKLNHIMCIYKNCISYKDYQEADQLPVILEAEVKKSIESNPSASKSMIKRKNTLNALTPAEAFDADERYFKLIVDAVGENLSPQEREYRLLARLMHDSLSFEQHAFLREMGCDLIGVYFPEVRETNFDVMRRRVPHTMI